MRKQSGTELKLLFLLLLPATLCMGESVIGIYISIPNEIMNWTDARTYCQTNHVDLVTMDKVDKSTLSLVLDRVRVEEVWIGLRRDPEKDSVWKRTLLTGEGITGNDVSRSRDWDDGQQDSHCAFLNFDLMWYSDACSQSHAFYCYENNTILLHGKEISWYNASKLCRAHRGELATINHKDPEVTERGWIGLHRQGGNTWKWIGQQESDYRNWAPGEPLTVDCGSFKADNKKWYGDVCSEMKHFACFGDKVLLVNENKTWEEALEHCRALKIPCEDPMKSCMIHHDLLSLNGSTEPEYIYLRERSHRATTDELWTGLRFLGGEWFWVNGKRLSNSSGDLPDCPSDWRHCGTLSKDQTQQWIIRDCSERRNFLCSQKTVNTDTSQ